MVSWPLAAVIEPQSPSPTFFGGEIPKVYVYAPVLFPSPVESSPKLGSVDVVLLFSEDGRMIQVG